MSYYDDPGVPGGRMCEACEQDQHWLCGMQTWCECDCAGPDGVYYEGLPPDVQDLSAGHSGD